VTWEWKDALNPTTSLAHVGRGSIALNVEIPGVGVYQSYSYTPTDSWFSSGWNNETSYLFDYLEFDIGRFNERISYLEADLKVSPITIKIADVAGGMTAQLKEWKTRANTRLITSVTSTATTFSTLDTGDFAAGTALMWIGQECIKRTGITGVSFTGLTRGYLGTQQQPYNVVATDIPPTRPLITDGVAGLFKRSVYIHAAVIDPGTGTPGPSQIIFRGRVKKGSKIGKGKLELAIEHKVAVFGDKVGQDMPSTGIPKQQYWCSGVSEVDGGFGSNSFALRGTSIPGSRSGLYITPDEGRYVGHEGGSGNLLSQAWNTKSNALPSSPAVTPRLVWRENRYVLQCDAPGASLSAAVTVYFGSPLWMLGFEPGFYAGAENTALEFKAQSAPRAFAYDCNNSDVTLPYLRVDDPDVLTANLRGQVSGNYACKITNTDTFPALPGSNIVTIDPLNGDFWGELEFRRGQLFYIVDDENMLNLRHAIVLGGAEDTYPQTLTTNALRRLLGVDRATSGVDEPRSWFPADVRGDDVDWDELDEAMLSVPAEFQVWHDVILTGIQVWKAIGPLFALLGISPRITDNGKIGFQRMDDMLALSAETVEVDSDVWDGINAAQVMGRLAHGPLVNQVVVRHSYDYRFEDGDPVRLAGIRVSGPGGTHYGFGAPNTEWGPPIKVRNATGMADFAGVKSVEYKLRGWRPKIESATPLESYAEIIRLQLNATHFTLYGLESGVTSIPVTWIGKQFNVGDTVILTHEVVPDTADGAVGITAKPVKIEGAIRNVTREQPDEFTIRYGPTTFITGIAPCALGTAWNQGTKTVTFSTAATPIYEQSGNNDLDRFVSSSTMNVVFTEYDATSPTIWTGTITAGGATPGSLTAVLSSDVFSTAFPATGVWMVYADWDDASAAQQAFCYSADTGVPPTLGTGDAHTKEWSL
jgi:hypothetical protein